MSTRRDFIKKAAMVSGATGIASMLTQSILKALSIDPALGTTFLDAEHVVILMQENRSFDHCFGSLRGVRGFNDPRAITLPDEKPVWLQTNKAGETYAPFRLNIKDTKATWMGSLPHNWMNQVDARNEGKMDRWLDEKKSGHAPFAKMPLTMGYYNREDLPFYYSLADAFTVCDQNFCSSLTGTTPNRLFLWTGTIREAQNEEVQARVMNEDADYETEVSWTTFPERLEAEGISWKVYQNEISAGVGFTEEEDAWLANFGDNPLEYFTQFQVRFSPAYIKNLPAKIAKLSAEIISLKEKITNGNEAEKNGTVIKKKQQLLLRYHAEEKKYTASNFQHLTPHEKNIHQKAFITNTGDPDYHSLDTSHDGTSKEMKIPKGDLLHQFRSDVKDGKLPTVSWLVAPENLSDHPSAPWYGAAYVSEAMDILTANPEVWKKTIFILCYDENDGYFDHVPPFTAPNSSQSETGGVSTGIDTRVDYVTRGQDQKWRPVDQARESPIGLGFRVPLVIASPWSRGGVVNSQVFDHTSILQFLEKFLSAKTKKKIEEPNISSWRRTVCGDLTSVFKPYNGEAIALPVFVKKNEFYEQVHEAKSKKDPGEFHQFSPADIEAVLHNPQGSSYMPCQEKGTRPASALPYELYVDGGLSKDRTLFKIKFNASNQVFGGKSAGAPFNVYAQDKFKNIETSSSAKIEFQNVRTWAYAVKAGSDFSDSWLLNDFESKNYHLRVYGPNGFYRSFKGNKNDPMVSILYQYEIRNNKLTGNLLLQIMNNEHKGVTLELKDISYNTEVVVKKLAPNESTTVLVDLTKSFRWYDLSVQISGFNNFEQRCAGRIETGEAGISDPAMGGISN